MHTGMPSFAMVLDTVVKSTVLLALAWSAALILKKRSAATQHMLRAFTLAALLLLPFSVLLLPAWHVKGIPEFSKPRSSASRQTVAQPAATATSFVKAPEAPAITAKRTAVTASAAPATARFKSEAGVASDQKDQRVTSSISAASRPRLPATHLAAAHESNASHASFAAIPPAWLPRLLLGLWIAGTLFFWRGGG